MNFRIERDIKRIIREYFEEFYANKFDNLGEMEKFLERQKLLTVTQEEIDDLMWIDIR